MIDDEPVGTRPARPFTESMLLDEYTKSRGLKKVTSRAALPRGTKSSYDQFAYGRKKELTGTYPGKTSYQRFLERQDASFQDSYLGKTKGKLFRSGKLTLKDFTDFEGREYTIPELRRKHAEAFKAIGL